MKIATGPAQKCSSAGVFGELKHTKKGHPAYIFSISSFSSSAPARSRLLPRTKTYSEEKPKRVRTRAWSMPAWGHLPQ